MPRPPRHFVPGFPAHLVHRGNNRQDIFHCEGDYRFLWRCLKEAAGEFEVAIHAYVFMTNHVHLLLTPQNDPFSVSNALHSASRRYAGYYNTRYQRTGTLWEGRFHAALVTDDRYLLACHRYIDLNPVRARLVDLPEAYPWSSHRVYAAGDSDSLVTPHWKVLSMGLDAPARRQAYRALFRESLDLDEADEIRKASLGCRPLGAARPRRGRPRGKIRP